MSFNIMDMVKGQISDQMVGQIGGLLGESPDKAKSAVDSALPTLLAGIGESAQDPNGADTLFNLVNRQDDSAASNIGSMIGSNQSSELIESGTRGLGSLLGSNGVTSMISGLAGHTGLGKGSAGSLLGMLTPMIFGQLKSKASADGLNASGLASMLKSQGSNISGAMPAGMLKSLESAGFGDARTQTTTTTTTGGGFSGGKVAAGAAAATAAGAAAVGSVGRGANNAASGAVGATRDAAGNVGQRAGSAVSGAADATRNAAGSAADSARGAARGATSGVANAAGNAVDATKNAAGSVGRGASNVAGAVGDTASRAGSAATGAVSGAAGAARNTASAAGNAAQRGVDAAGNKVGGAVDSGRDAVRNTTDTRTTTQTRSTTTGTRDTSRDSVSRNDYEAPAKKGGIWKWLLPIALAVLAWFGFKQLGHKEMSAEDAATGVTESAGEAAGNATDAASDATDAAADAASDATDAASDAAGDAADAASDAASGAMGSIGDFFGSTTETLEGITDADSATAALPKLEEASGAMDGLSGMLEGGGDAAKTALSDGMGKLGPVVEKLQGNEGIWGVLEPVVGPMMETLKGLGG